MSVSLFVFHVVFLTPMFFFLLKNECYSSHNKFKMEIPKEVKLFSISLTSTWVQNSGLKRFYAPINASVSTHVKHVRVHRHSMILYFISTKLILIDVVYQWRKHSANTASID